MEIIEHEGVDGSWRLAGCGSEAPPGLAVGLAIAEAERRRALRDVAGVGDGPVAARQRAQGRVRRAYFDAKKAAGKTSMEAMRALKRRLSNLVYTQMVADQKRRQAAGPGGHSGTTLQSSVTGPDPGHRLFG
jgi:hypothetical protein